MPALAKKCLASWEKFCPDYEIKRWDESNFDVNCCDYVREAYDAKKWAFVSDYVRLKALVDHGGIYLDTDVEVIKPLDTFLNKQGFSCFEGNEYISTCILACEKNFPPFIEMLDDYSTKHFYLQGGGLNNLTTNVKMITEYFSQHGFTPNNTLQTVMGFTIYPRDYFCAKDYITQAIELTSNTHAIHHFAASWLPLHRRMKSWLKRFVGVRNTMRIMAVKQFMRDILQR